MPTMNEFLEKALTNEALKLPKAKWITSRISNILNWKGYDKLEDFFRRNNKGISLILKDMEKIAGKPQFGKKSSLGTLVGALKNLQVKGDDLMDAWDDAEDAYNLSKDWGKEFKELNPEWDDK